MTLATQRQRQQQLGNQLLTTTIIINLEQMPQLQRHLHLQFEQPLITTIITNLEQMPQHQ